MRNRCEDGERSKTGEGERESTERERGGRERRGERTRIDGSDWDRVATVVDERCSERDMASLSETTTQNRVLVVDSRINYSDLASLRLVQLRSEGVERVEGNSLEHLDPKHHAREAYRLQSFDEEGRRRSCSPRRCCERWELR